MFITFKPTTGIFDETAFSYFSYLCREVLESPDMSSGAQCIEMEQLVSFANAFLAQGTTTNRLLAPWMLTCASQIMLAHTADGVSGATEDLCQKLVDTAEASSPIRVLHQLFAHESLCEPERQRRYADITFFVLGSWCKAFKLRISSLPYEAVQDVLSLLGSIFQENPVLTRSATPCYVLKLRFLQLWSYHLPSSATFCSA